MAMPKNTAWTPAQRQLWKQLNRYYWRDEELQWILKVFRPLPPELEKLILDKLQQTNKPERQRRPR